MTKEEKKVFQKLYQFTCIVRNRAPIGPLRSDGVAMSELIEGILEPNKNRIKTIDGKDIVTSVLKRDWLTK